MFSMFDSLEAQRQFAQRSDVAEHLEWVKPLVERAEVRI
jgi:hypothetical protein